MEFWNESKLGASKKMHLLQKKKKEYLWADLFIQEQEPV